MVNKYFFSSFLASSLFVFGIVFCAVFTSFAQTETPTPTPDPTQTTSSISACADNHITIAECPSYLQGKLTALAGQEQTLSSQIAVMNGQIQLTQARIYATEQQISNLTLDIDTANQKVNTIQSSLDGLTKVLLNRVVATYEVGTIQPLQMLLTSSDVTDFLKRLNYLKIAQAHDKRVVFDAVQAKNDYQNQKNIYEVEKIQVEALKAQLDAYNTQLDQQKVQKQQLLTQTQGDEATYERLLSSARAQLAGFSKFVAAQGGASILTNQTVCDDWGCYYNQRDAQWGNIGINGSSTSIAEAGCLMTSMAMVYTHYGHHVTPLDVNIGSNFFSTTAYLLKTITVAGTSSTRISSSIDSTLSSGNPVIVGISYDGGPIADHFVVLISGSGGNYQMNDPFTPNGHNISFTSHYSLGSIVEIDRVSL
jgi:peptidoglycan hydrolase CwlO-like protein